MLWCTGYLDQFAIEALRKPFAVVHKTKFGQSLSYRRPRIPLSFASDWIKLKHRLCAKLCAGVSGEEGVSAGARAVARAVEVEISPLVAQCAEVLDLACKHIDSLVNKAEEYQVLHLLSDCDLGSLARMLYWTPKAVIDITSHVCARMFMTGAEIDSKAISG